MGHQISRHYIVRYLIFLKSVTPFWFAYISAPWYCTDMYSRWIALGTKRLEGIKSNRVLHKSKLNIRILFLISWKFVIIFNYFKVFVPSLSSSLFFSSLETNKSSVRFVVSVFLVFQPQHHIWYFRESSRINLGGNLSISTSTWRENQLKNEYHSTLKSTKEKGDKPFPKYLNLESYSRLMKDKHKRTKLSKSDGDQFQCCYNNKGYCRFGKQCRYKHYKERCKIRIYREKECPFRHPQNISVMSKIHLRYTWKMP